MPSVMRGYTSGEIERALGGFKGEGGLMLVFGVWGIS